MSNYPQPEVRGHVPYCVSTCPLFSKEEGKEHRTYGKCEADNNTVILQEHCLPVVRRAMKIAGAALELDPEPKSHPAED